MFSKVPWILTSPDGLNWAASTPANTNSLRAIAFGNGVYVVGGDRGQIGVSQRPQLSLASLKLASVWRP